MEKLGFVESCNRFYYGFEGKLNLLSMAVKTYFLVAVTITFALLSQFTLIVHYLDMAFNQKIAKFFTGPKIILELVIATLVVSIIFTILKYLRLERNVRMLKLSPQEKTKLMESIELSDEYRDSGYQIKFFDDGVTGKQYYVTSDDVNRYLQRADAKIPVRRASRYRLPHDIESLVPAIMAKHIRKSQFLFNGKLLKQNASLVFDAQGELPELDVSRTGYFDGQCSHEIVFKKFLKKRDIGISLWGPKLLVDDENKLHPLELSSCANFLGGSTLVFTSDGKIMVALQGQYSKASPNCYVPSGSGSVEWRGDFTRTHFRTLDQVVINAMEREFCEEWGLRKPARLKMTTALIGYVRLLERGGKPDYFGLTYIDMPYDELQQLSKFKKFIAPSEIGMQQTSDKILKFDSGERLKAELEKLLAENKGKKDGEKRCSIQIYLVKEFIREMVDAGTLEEFLLTRLGLDVNRLPKLPPEGKPADTQS